MGKKGLKIIGCLFILFFIPQGLFAGPGVKILTSTGQGLASVRINLDEMQPFSSTLRFIDPNFQKDGKTDATGITFKTLLSMSEAFIDEGVTVIGSDQYTGYIPFHVLEKDQALLAWGLNGTPIGRMKGGPFKVVYPDIASVHGSCYVWYVETIIAGTLEHPSFQLIRKGETKTLGISDLAAKGERLDETLFSLPAGCRGNIEPIGSKREIKAITLNRLIHLFSDRNVSQVTFIPLAGQGIRINKAALSFPIYITLSLDGKPIHPSLGGPFSVIFPVEQHPALSSIVPESGALFFLDKIIVE